MFQLTKEEIEELSRCNFFTSMQIKGIKGGRVYLPYAFTEQGVSMLAMATQAAMSSSGQASLSGSFII